MAAYCYIFLLLYFCFSINLLTSAQEDDAEKKEEEEAEGEYVVHRNRLQEDLLKGYDKKKRPVRNASDDVLVTAHVEIGHLSVNQREQTITLSGVIYMMWYDEFAVWDPAQYADIKTIMLNQWNLWFPEIKVANSVSGYYRDYEISRWTIAKLESRSPNRTQVEIYPRFRVKIGCRFDYSRYPNDVQICYMGMFPVNRMDEVSLSPWYTGIHTPLANWYPFTTGVEETRFKEHIGEWHIKEIVHGSFYFFDGQQISEKPEDAEQIDRTWTVLLTRLELERHTPYYMWSMVVPATVSFLAIIVSYFLPSPTSSTYVLLANFVLIDIFFEDLFTQLPPIVGGLPRIIYYLGVILVLTTVSLFVQYWFNCLLESSGSPTGFVLEVAKLKRFLPRSLQGRVANDTLVAVSEEKATATVDETVSWQTVVNVVRILIACVLFICFLIFTRFLLV